MTPSIAQALEALDDIALSLQVGNHSVSLVRSALKRAAAEMEALKLKVADLDERLAVADAEIRELEVT